MAQEMDEDAEEELQELDKIFAKIDSDNDGVLSWEELVKGGELLDFTVRGVVKGSLCFAIMYRLTQHLL